MESSDRSPQRRRPAASGRSFSSASFLDQDLVVSGGIVRPGNVSSTVDGRDGRVGGVAGSPTDPLSCEPPSTEVGQPPVHHIVVAGPLVVVRDLNDVVEVIEVDGIGAGGCGRISEPCRADPEPGLSIVVQPLVYDLAVPRIIRLVDDVNILVFGSGPGRRESVVLLVSGVKVQFAALSPRSELRRYRISKSWPSSRRH